MALLLETTLGDIVIDLDVEGSPELCKNVLKLAKARYYTSSLVYNVQVNRFCQLGDPQGDGSGGACVYGLISTLLNDGELRNERVLQSQQRFLKSGMGRLLTPEECQEKGRVVATEMKGVFDTIGSQLLITTCSGKDVALDGFRMNENGDDRQSFRSVGIVTEDDNNVLDQIAAAYCDADGRPYADIRIIRALVVDDPFDDPPGLDQLLKVRGVEMDSDHVVSMSPEYERPPEEKVEIRIQADQVDLITGEEDIEKIREQEEELLKRDDKSRAVVLEMLGDLPDADMTAPENVLFVCKLNPVTEDEDLELIFSRFDEKVKAEIIRDHDTGASLQYAFVEFSTKQQAAEAYFKMNNALVDDRRIKVDFSQSVAKVWNKFSQRIRNPKGQRSNKEMPRDPFTDSFRRPPGLGLDGRSGRGGWGAIRGQGRDQDDRRDTSVDHRRHIASRGHGQGDFKKPNDRTVAKRRGDYDDFGRQHPPQRLGDHPSDNRRGRDPGRDQGREHSDHYDADRKHRTSKDGDIEGASDRHRRSKRERSQSGDRKRRNKSRDGQKVHRDESSDDSRSRDSESHKKRKRDGHGRRHHRDRRERGGERKEEGSDDKERKKHRKRDHSDHSKRRNRDDDEHRRRRPEYK
jgi:peptidyl-prolyl cis-trans isomerase-like 4